MLLIDGVRYEEWAPQSEEEFERVVKEHAKDIFGENSIYFDLKKKLTTKAGIKSIPDGYVFILSKPAQWYIVEVELSSHELYDHIVPQVTKFINGVKSFQNQKEITDALYQEINDDASKKALIISKIGSGEVYHFTSNLVSEMPTLAIIIERNKDELEEVSKSLPIKAEIIQLHTFTKESKKLSPEHAHLFEPVFTAGGPSPVTQKSQLYQQFFTELIERYCISHPTQRKIKALPQSWAGFGAGRTGFTYNWFFTADKRFGVELYIDTTDKAKNKMFLDKIRELDTQIGIGGLSWQKLPERRASRIAKHIDGKIEDATNDPKMKEHLVQWGLDAMNDFSTKFSDIIDNL